MLNALLFAVLMVQAGQSQSSPPASAPVQVSEREARQHSLDSEFLYIRIPKHREISDSLDVTVTVDETGAVVSAHAAPEGRNVEYKNSPALLAQAESLAYKRKYSPFNRGGRAIVVRFTEVVFLLPPELKPAKHVAFPRVKDWNSVRIGLTRTSCYGSCPSYSVEIAGNGSVTYDGHSDVTFTGHHKGLITPRQVMDLVREFEKADFYSLADQYSTTVTDNPTQTLFVSIDGRRKQVVDYVGIESGMPLSVLRLEAEVDRVSGSERWTRGNADTIAALESEHWNFKSPEAAATLVRATQRGNAAVVRDLVRAGVPLNGRGRWGFPSRGDGGPLAALAFAAYRGDTDMLRALAEGGAISDPRARNDAVVAAARSRNVEAYRLLLTYGAPPNPRDSGGTTALMAAAASGSPAMVEELLNRHADVNASRAAPRPPCKKDSDCEEIDGDGATALMEAVKASDYDDLQEGVDRVQVVRLLLDAKADVNARDKQGNTALIECDHNARQAELLLKAGADPNAHNLEGTTALLHTYNEDVKRVLRQYGAIELKAADEKQ